jgi:hypothetical protein
MVVQHLVLGHRISEWTGQTEIGYEVVPSGEVLFDDSLEGLERLYGVPWSNIAEATFGAATQAAIYGWLSRNGGVQPTPGVWGMAPGMVVNIPNVSESKSPIESAAEKGVVAKPGGSEVAVGDPTLAPGGTGTTVATAAVGGDWTMWLLLGVAAWILFTPTKKGRKGKKLTARRGRRKSRKSSWW